MSNSSISSFKGRAYHVLAFLFFLAMVLLGTGLLQRLAINRFCSGKRLFLGEEKTTLLLGDSHCEYSLDPSVNGSWANIALSGENTVCSFYKLKKYLQCNPQIRTVVYTCSTHNLTAGMDVVFLDERSQDAYFHRYYRLFDKDGLSFTSCMKSRLRGFLAYTLWLPLEWDRNTLKMLATRTPPFQGTFNPAPVFEVTPTNTQQEIRLQFYTADGKAEDSSPFQIEYLRRLCELACDSGIDLIIISTPLHPIYRELVPKQMDDLFSQTISTIQSNYPQVKYIDFRSQFDSSQSAYYSNGDHLSADGARAFSEMLISNKLIQ